MRVIPILSNQRLFTTDSPTFAGLTITNACVLGSNSAVFQPTTDATTFFQILDADGGTPIFNVDSTNERVGIGVADPDTTLEIYKVGTQLKLSGGAGDYATFAVAADGALTITTVDLTAAEGDIILAPDGCVGIHDTAPGTMLQLKGADAYVTLQNSTAENGEGEAETRLIFEDHANAALAQIEGHHEGTTDDTKGGLTFSTHTGSALTVALSINELQYIGIGAHVDAGTLLQLAYDGDAYLTLQNLTNENSEGGAETKIIFEDHSNTALAQIEGSHSGTADDTKGKLILSTHTGSALTAALTISDTQLATFGGNILIPDAGQIGSASDTNAITISATGEVDITAHNLATTGLKLGGTLVTSSAAELNLLDGVTAVQEQGDVLDDLNTLGAPTADGEFIVATGAGAFAYETTTTARASLGIGESDSPTFAGLTIGAAGHVVLPLHNDAATPTLAFGDGDTGFYEPSDDAIYISLGGAVKYYISTTGMYAAAGAMISGSAAAPTTPSIVPSINDADNGLGLDGADGLSIIAGGVQAILVSEATTITTRLSDKIRLSNTAEGNTGSMDVNTAREVHTLAAAAQSDTTINIPDGTILLGVSFCVNTAVTDDGGDDTWNAAYTGGSATVLGTNEAAAQNTKVDTLVAPEKASAQTNIRFTPNGGNFSAGVIEVIAYYIDLTSLANV